jgi:DNA-binding LacI/PurR family transcriptional regulator
LRRPEYVFEYVFKRELSTLTQRKIAELANVSQPTVSRILGGDMSVDPETRERVLDIVRRHGYQPHAQARGLRTHRTDTIGLAVRRGRKDFAKDPFYAELITAVMDLATQHGFHLSLSSSRTSGGERLFYDSLFRSNRIDGLLILESHEHDERIERLRAHGFPFVLIGRYDGSEDIFTVNNDNVGGARELTRYLIEKGHRRIGFITGPADLTVCQDRLTGYTEALESAGIEPDPALVAEADFGEQGGRRAALKLLEAKPTAIVALDDLICLGALAAVKGAGLRSPDDIALAGFNDSQFCPHTDPPLTSVRLNVTELGERAAELLISRIRNPKMEPVHVLVPCEIVRRESA